MFIPMQIPGIDQQDIAQADSLVRAEITESVHTFAGMTWQERFHAIFNELWQVGLKVLAVLVLFVVCRWLIRRFVRMLDAIFEKRNVDPSLRTFIRYLVNILLYMVLFYLMIAWLGVNTSLFVALFAAAGLAIGMAMSGVFQNFAGGVMILLLKPFHVGDFIETEGQSGTVKEIKLFNTVLRTLDNKTILLPNGGVSTGIVNNYSAARMRRVDWTFSLALDSDFDRAREVLLELLRTRPKIAADPAPEVLMNKIGNDSIDLVVQAWVANADYLDVFYSVTAAIYKTMPEKGFAFPTSTLAVTLDDGSKDRKVKDTGKNKGA